MSHGTDQFTRALQRLVDTLNSRGVAERVDRAFASDAVLERFDPGEMEGDSERIQGSLAIGRWMAKVPVTTRFALAGKCRLVDGKATPAASVRYRYEWNGMLHGGVWVVQLANDGRLSHWAHHPDVLSTQKEQVAAFRSDAQPTHEHAHVHSTATGAENPGAPKAGRGRRRRGRGRKQG